MCKDMHSKNTAFTEYWKPPAFILPGEGICLEDCRTFKLDLWINILLT